MKRIYLLLSAAIISLSAQAQTKLIIDPGHGGKDQGAVSAAGDKESELCMQFAHAIEAQAKAKHIQVVFTHSDKESADMQARLSAAKGAHTYFLSIHMNSSDNPETKGQEVIIAKEPKNIESMTFGKKLMQQMQQIGDVQINLKNIMILNESAAPAVIYSPGYISNKQDLQLLKTASYQQRVAMQIVDLLSKM